MDSFSAFARGMANRGREERVFDWDKAARLMFEHKAENADAGLEEDWSCTGGPILRDGIPVPRSDTYTYLASTWATPTLTIDGETHECWRMKSDTPGWGSDTYWPESALAILAITMPTESPTE